MKCLIYKERIKPIRYLPDQERFMGFQQFTQAWVNLEEQEGYLRNLEIDHT